MKLDRDPSRRFEGSLDLGPMRSAEGLERAQR